MILVRDIFQLKFGKAKEAKVLAKELAELQKKHSYSVARLLTDLTGPYYTLVMERTFPNLGDFEQALKTTLGTKEFGKVYKKFVPLIDSGSREIFTIVE
jgi:hypothetical protein